LYLSCKNVKILALQSIIAHIKKNLWETCLNRRYERLNPILGTTTIEALVALALLDTSPFLPFPRSMDILQKHPPDFS
jgi:hypothetical protein